MPEVRLPAPTGVPRVAGSRWAPGAGTNQWAVLAIAALATAFVWIDASALNIAFPALERSFPGASRSGLSWVLNGYNIVFAALLVPAGRLADLLGRRRLFIAGLLLFSGASALCAVAPSVPVLVTCRVVQGAGAAVMIPAALALILVAFPPAQIATAVSLWISAGAAASAFGPVVGGTMIQIASWRWIFLVNVPIAACAIAFGYRALPAAGGSSERRLPDFLGTATLGLGVTCLALALVEGREWGWTSVPILTSLALSPVLLAITVLRSGSHPAPVLDLPLIRLRRVAIANAGTLVFGAAMFGSFLANVLFLTSVWRYSELHAALAVSPPPLVAAICGTRAGGLIERYGPRFVALLGTGLFAAGIGWILSKAGSRPDYLGAWLPGTVLFGAGIGTGFSAFASTAIRAAPVQAFGLASSLNTAGRQVGMVLGVAVLVAVIGDPRPGAALSAFRSGWTVAIATTAVAALLACGLSRPPVVISEPS
jgi:EmrB/QacA subfamily drug resistance transporter